MQLTAYHAIARLLRSRTLRLPRVPHTRIGREKRDQHKERLRRRLCHAPNCETIPLSKEVGLS